MVLHYFQISTFAEVCGVVAEQKRLRQLQVSHFNLLLDTGGSNHFKLLQMAQNIYLPNQNWLDY